MWYFLWYFVLHCSDLKHVNSIINWKFWCHAQNRNYHWEMKKWGFKCNILWQEWKKHQANMLIYVFTQISTRVYGAIWNDMNTLWYQSWGNFYFWKWTQKSGPSHLFNCAVANVIDANFKHSLQNSKNLLKQVKS